MAQDWTNQWDRIKSRNRYKYMWQFSIYHKDGITNQWGKDELFDKLAKHINTLGLFNKWHHENVRIKNTGECYYNLRAEVLPNS